jgi:hypothetical protein
MVVAALAERLLVVIVLPAPDVIEDELETGDVQVASLCRVTVAFSDRLNVTVGVRVVAKFAGEMDV